jgi:hypothetical protein
MLPEPVEDAVPSRMFCATFAEYVATLPLWKSDLIAKATEAALILPCSNYCNKGTLTYYSQAMAAIRMNTALVG